LNPKTYSMKNLLALIPVLLIFACQEQPETKNTSLKARSLKDAYQDVFYIGTALNTGQIFERDSATHAVITSQFNAIVAENCMKGENIHPEEDRYYWEEADAFVKFGEKYNMHITGHTLAWHSQAPPWLFVDEQGKDISRTILIERMSAHITTIMQRYKGKVAGWDVVNEAILDDGTMRKSKYYEIIGPDWVEIAFKIAQEADPETELYYNDYSLSNPEKRAGVYQLVKGMQDKGIKVDGIGMQGHLNMGSPNIQDFEESVVQFSTLGKVMITEMDITVLPWPSGRVSAEVSLSAEYQESMNPYKDGLTDSMAVALNDRFVAFYELFNKHQDKITRVTMWGVNDAQTWRNNWPIRGRKDFPLLFNRDNSPKPAVERIIGIRKDKP